jgi:hypothetical protein
VHNIFVTIEQFDKIKLNKLK